MKLRLSDSLVGISFQRIINLPTFPLIFMQSLNVTILPVFDIANTKTKACLLERTRERKNIEDRSTPIHEVTSYR